MDISKAIDTQFCEIWNSAHPSETVHEEHFWDICRQLESCNIVESDNTSIGSMSIGPFNIASTLKVEKKSFFNFFINVVLPAAVAKGVAPTFPEAYALFIQPAVNLFVGLTDNNFIIEDELQWEILMYIKEKNKHNIFPSVEQVVNEIDYGDYSSNDIRNKLFELKDVKSLFGDKHSLINIDYENRIECLV